MIHVRADQVKNTKNAVADNFSGSSAFSTLYSQAFGSEE